MRQMGTLTAIECEAFAAVLGHNANTPRHTDMLQRILHRIALPSQRSRLQSLGGIGQIGLLKGREDEPAKTSGTGDTELLVVVGGIANKRPARPHGAYRGGAAPFLEGAQSLYDVCKTARHLPEIEEAAWLVVDLEHRKVLLLEDKHGTRPLYVCQYEHALYVSTSGMALAELTGRRINPGYIYDSLVQSFRSLEFFWAGIEVVGAREIEGVCAFGHPSSTPSTV